MKCRSGVPEIYLRRSINDYRNNVDDQVIETVEGYIAHLPEMKSEGTGIHFFGPNGTGKTGLMCEVLKAISPATKFTAVFSTLNGICDMVAESWNSVEAKEDYKEFVLRSDFLAIDDAGREYRGRTDFIVSVFDQVLRNRAIHCRPTLITSNFNSEEIESVYGSSVASLLNDAFIPLMLTGRDFRKTLQGRRIDNLLEMMKNRETGSSIITEFST